MVIREDLSLREVARELDIEPRRLNRLCRYLQLDCTRQRIPLDKVLLIRAEPNPDLRYAEVRSLLIRFSGGNA